jgi:hypothetical protein
MNVPESFLAYFNAFEATYVDDDWSRLEPLFAPDAVYRVSGSGIYDCELRGRDAVFAGLRKFLDGFDRRCTRRLGSLEPPSFSGDTATIVGVAVYTRDGSPPFEIALREDIEFRDGLITRITDTYDCGWESGLPEEAQEWMRTYGSDLTLGYV